MIYNTLYRTDGISDDDRVKNSLVVNSFRVHELSREELVTCCRYYGRKIRYFNFRNEPDGTWADCFSGDEMAVLSDISCFDMSTFVKNSRIILGSGNDSIPSFHSIVVNAVKVMKKIDSWYVQLSAIDNHIASLAAHTVGNLVSECAGDIFTDIIELVKKYSSTENRIVIPRMSTVWNPCTAGKVMREKKADRATLCRTIIVSLHGLVQSIKRSTRIFIDESLDSNNHSPETAMLLAFLDLLKNVQNEINLIPEKYIRFYYDNILQFGKKETVPEKVYVTAVPDSSIKDDIILAQGTEFAAVHEGIEEIYKSENDLVVKNCHVSSIYTLCLRHDKYIEPEKTLKFYSGIELADCINRAENETEGEFAVFGDSVNGNPVRRSGIPALSGWAIASKILLLAEGERLVRIQLSLNNDLHKCWNDEFKKKLAAGTALTDEYKQEYDMNGFFRKVLNSLLVIELTAPDGWYKVLQYCAVTPVTEEKAQKNTVTLEFVIPVNAPAIVPYDEKVHCGGFSTSLPVCKFTYNNDTEIYPYSLLKGLSLNSVHIDVQVKGVSDLLLYNQYGALDVNTPFMPFGPMPSRGDHLIIGSHEMANKNVDMVDIDISWANVPWQENGFRDYYAGYSYQIDNNSFQVSVSELKEGTWFTDNDERCSRISIFESVGSGAYGEGAGKIKNTKHIDNIPIHCMREKTGLTDKENSGYTCRSKDGFLRLELTSPAFGFGHILYTAETASLFMSQMFLKKKIVLPQPPYVPVVNRLRVGYHAHTSINFSHVYSQGTDFSKMDAFFHLYPLGVHHLYPVNDIENVTLVPELDKVGAMQGMDGNLFIGIKGNRPCGYLSLHFRMAQEMLLKKTTGVVWSYLRSNRWIPIEPRSIVDDTTCGLAVTGIVTLYLPDDLENEETVMPAGTYWLRVSAEENIAAFGSIASITANGVRLYSCSLHGESRMQRNLPSGSIKGLTATVPGIDSIVQHEASCQGTGIEKDEMYLARASERLRHKNRAVTVYDYEHIIMDCFPQIMKVKCFPNMISSDAKYIHPGHVLIAVIAWPQNMGVEEYASPKVNGKLLSTIENHVRKISPAGARIEVINPVYEEIQLRCAIVLKRNVSQVNTVYNVNKAVSDYISPWSKVGNASCFGWKIRLSEVEQFLHSLPQVDHVTDFSMLQKTVSGSRKYSLYDSAGESGIDEKESGRCICPQVPWSISIPFRFHAIEVISDIENRKPLVTGISKADVGNILIVKGKNGYGTAEQENA